MGSVFNSPMQRLFVKGAMQMKRFTIMLILTFLLNGCATKPVSETVAEAAKETISAIYNTLPKECQTKEVKEAHANAQKQVDNVVRSCNLEKSNLEAKLRYKNLLVLGLSVLVCILLVLLLRRTLSRISLPTLGNLLGRNNQNNENQ